MMTTSINNELVWLNNKHANDVNENGDCGSESIDSNVVLRSCLTFSVTNCTQHSKLDSLIIEYSTIALYYCLLIHNTDCVKEMYAFKYSSF